MFEVILPLILTLIAALLAFITQFYTRKLTVWISNLALLTGLVLAFYGWGLAYFFSPLPIYFETDWLNAGWLKVALSFQLDEPAALYQVLIYGVSLMVSFFSTTYMQNERIAFWPILLLFVWSMNFLVLTNHVLTLFIAWELVGFCSFLMIGFWYQKSEAANSATFVLWINRFGDFVLLFGLLLLCSLTHFDVISNLKLYINSNTQILIEIAGVIIGLGAICKSAQVVYYVWLPKAMTGPTPASALIHAATMVTAGVWLCLKLVYTGHFTWLTVFLSYTGISTAVWVSLLALSSKDPKQLLAYSTIAQLGIMFLAIGIAPTGKAAFLHLLTHGVYKSGLFLSIASINQILDSKNIAYDKHNFNTYPPNTLLRLTPYTFIAHTVLTAALVGLPFTASFLSKEAIILWTYNNGNTYHFCALLLTTFLTAFYGVRIWFNLWRPDRMLTNFSLKFNRISSQEFVLLTLATLSIGLLWSSHPLLELENIIWGWNYSAKNNTETSITTNLSTLLTIISLTIILGGGFLGIMRNDFYFQGMKNIELLILSKISSWFISILSLKLRSVRAIEFYCFYRPAEVIAQVIAQIKINRRYYSLAMTVQQAENILIEQPIRYIIDKITQIRSKIIKTHHNQIQSYVGWSVLLVVLVFVLMRLIQ